MLVTKRFGFILGNFEVADGTKAAFVNLGFRSLTGHSPPPKLTHAP